MPWKGEKDPYKIWLSEIILQQTRVEQGLIYYENFVKAFPTVHHLAKAPEQKVFKLWEGLGYYTRCKNLIISAKHISEKFYGNFPDTYQQILELKGIGPYTAAAVASFAYNLPHAVVDGNVFRLLSRYFGINTPIDTTVGKSKFTRLANELVSKQTPAQYNQAIMDFGAVVCKPKQPACGSCVLQTQCVAFKKKQVEVLPVKEKKRKNKTRWFHYFIIKAGEEVLISKRSEKDIWENLHQYFLYESKEPLSPDKKTYTRLFNRLTKTPRPKVEAISEEYRQQLSHQTIIGRFVEIACSKDEIGIGNNYRWIKESAFKRYAFPRIIVAFQQAKISR